MHTQTNTYTCTHMPKYTHTHTHTHTRAHTETNTYTHTLTTHTHTPTLHPLLHTCILYLNVVATDIIHPVPSWQFILQAVHIIFHSSAAQLLTCLTGEGVNLQMYRYILDTLLITMGKMLTNTWYLTHHLGTMLTPKDYHIKLALRFLRRNLKNVRYIAFLVL